MQATLSRTATSYRSRYNEPLTLDEINKYAPSILAAEPHESRGPRYLYISTQDILQGLQQHGFQPYQVAQTRVRDESKRDFTKHMIRFRHPDARALVKVGDEIPEIVLINSHDGTSSFQIMGGVFRLVCLNGMVVGDTRTDVKVRHSGKTLDNVIEGSFRVIGEMKQIVGVMDEYRSTILKPEEQIIFAHAAHQARWGAAKEEAQEVEVHQTFKPLDLLKPRRVQDDKPDLWTTFNRIQENMIKGGMLGRSESGRNIRSRPVNSVTEDVKLNRALWILTEQMNQLKNG